MTNKTLSVFDPRSKERTHFDYAYFSPIRIPEQVQQQPTANLDHVDSATKRLSLAQNRRRIKRAIKYINDHLINTPSLEDVAKHVDLSQCYFSKLFKQQQGVGFNLYVNQQRMKQAKLLLDMPELSIATVAKNLGFSQTSYFCRLFRQIYQITPQTYRNQSGKE